MNSVPMFQQPSAADNLMSSLFSSGGATPPIRNTGGNSLEGALQALKSMYGPLLDPLTLAEQLSLGGGGGAAAQPMQRAQNTPIQLQAAQLPQGLNPFVQQQQQWAPPKVSNLGMGPLFGGR